MLLKPVFISYVLDVHVQLLCESPTLRLNPDAQVTSLNKQLLLVYISILLEHYSSCDPGQ